MPYNVSIIKMRTGEKIVTDATVTVMGLIEILHHFIDISNDDWVRFLQDLGVYPECSIMGPDDIQEAFEIKVRVIPNMIITYEEPHEGFWRKVWNVISW